MAHFLTCIAYRASLWQIYNLNLISGTYF